MLFLGYYNFILEIILSLVLKLDNLRIRMFQEKNPDFVLSTKTFTVKLSCTVYRVQFPLSDTGDHLSKGQTDSKCVCFCVSIVIYHLEYSLGPS